MPVIYSSGGNRRGPLSEMSRCRTGRGRARQVAGEASSNLTRRDRDLPMPYVISDIMDPVEQVDGKFYTSKPVSHGGPRAGADRGWQREAKAAAASRVHKPDPTGLDQEGDRAVQGGHYARGGDQAVYDRRCAMPSKSAKPRRELMAAVAHNPKFAKKVGIPQSVGEEFNEADKRRGAIKKAMNKARSKRP